jgi:LPPG:FO 2-phospho-L-lactate transferase
MTSDDSVTVIVLSGGVGGAKFVSGLYDILAPGELAVIVNTGDDFDHLGLRICPDIDSITYALAGINDEKRGWGRDHETWNALETLRQLGADDWFVLGDKDIGLHLFRHHWLQQKRTLSELTQTISRQFDIRCQIIPMTESTVETFLETDQGTLSFQDYFVKHQGLPRVRRLDYRGAAAATLHSLASTALNSKRLRAIFVAPSNPLLSIDPILAIPESRDVITRRGLPVIAVSPIVQGRALKGPLTQMMESLGIPRSATGIAAHYRGLISGMVIDSADEAEATALNIPVCIAPIIMSDRAARQALARTALEFADSLANE